MQEPWELQADAIEDAVTGLANHARGRLVMACGTGKTFTSLRIAEQLVEDGQRILFAAPTIALVSQARREWLRQTTRPLSCIVVCSDPTAGGRNENEDIRVSELECPVSTDAAETAQGLVGEGPTRVVFCTYHSLGRVTEAQAEHGARSTWRSPTRPTGRPGRSSTAEAEAARGGTKDPTPQRSDRSPYGTAGACDQRLFPLP